MSWFIQELISFCGTAHVLQHNLCSNFKVPIFLLPRFHWTRRSRERIHKLLINICTSYVKYADVNKCTCKTIVGSFFIKLLFLPARTRLLYTSKSQFTGEWSQISLICDETRNKKPNPATREDKKTEKEDREGKKSNERR